VVVSSVARNGPAQKAGVQEGDRVLAVAGARVTDWRACGAACGPAATPARGCD
jgi:predicted metalloprotease with PDZ domain